jgi:hypothetical protein
MVEGLTVVYARNPGGGSSAEGQGGAVPSSAFYARPAPEGEGGLTLVSVRSAPQVQAREGETEGVGPFWSRPKEGESGLVAVPASTLVQGGDKEAPKGLDVQGVGGKSGGGENAGLQVYIPTSGGSQTGTGGGEGGDPSGILGKSGELQIVWRRAQEQVRGGVVPPGARTASNPGFSVGSQGFPAPSSGAAGEGSPKPPSPGAP